MANSSKPKNKSLIDKIIYPFALISPFVALPQFYDIWFLHKASGVSALSWGGFAFMSALWIIHAFIHKDKILLFNMCLIFFFNLSITLGALIFS